MKKRKKRLSRKTGLPPGTPIHIGDTLVEKSKITVFEYGIEGYQEKQLKSFDELFQFKTSYPVTWINIDGLNQVEFIERTCKMFNIHPLTTEDIVNTSQRPKVDEYTDYLYIVLKMLKYDKLQNDLYSEQVSVVMRHQLLISFQETEGDVFETVRDRIRKGKGKIRSVGSDYLTYALIDAIVDHYFVVVDTFSETIESLEEELLEKPSKSTIESIHALKRHVILFRRNVWPLRETIHSIIKGDFPYFHEQTKIYLKDVYDHTLHIIDSIESFRDILSGMMELYLTTVSNRLNEVMKVLTIIATIFIPLTFIAGVYGMNFKYMPELEWEWGYYVIWAVMITIAIGMLILFKRKSWI